jgi:LacI family transcriptional regulator
MGTVATEILLRRIMSGNKNYQFETRVLNADLIIRGSSVKEILA